jgi:cytochrome c553
MQRLSLGILVVALIASTVALKSMGGWAVVSVSKIPDAWIAGKPLQLTWQVRQHAVAPLYGLRPTLEARSGSRRITGRTWEFNEAGVRGYRGSITFPQRGNWQVTIHSGFGRSRAVLLPWPVVDSVTRVRGTVEDHLARMPIAPLSEPERGRRMFAAKGCVTCHVHRSVGIAGELRDFGPELTERQLPAEYLRRYLADPSIKPATNGRRMPNPGLREKDIDPLVAFLSARPAVATGRSDAP